MRYSEETLGSPGVDASGLLGVVPLVPFWLLSCGGVGAGLNKLVIPDTTIPG